MTDGASKSASRKAASMKSFPRLRFTMPFLAAISLVIVGSANADVGVLVTNFDQGGATYNLVGSRESAQSFNTGSNAGGYVLEGIDVRVYLFDGDVDDVTLSLLSSDSGEPGAELFDLAYDETHDINSFGQAEFRFSAPADVDSSLDPGTKYFVFVHYADASGFVRWETTDDDEDSGKASGWNIGNTSHWRTAGSNNDWSEYTNSRPFRIKVHGEINTAPTTDDKTVSTNEDIAYIFGTGDFDYEDEDGDTLDHVKITSLPGTGKGNLSIRRGGLTSNITSVTPPEQVTQAELSGGKFKYHPPADEHGTGFTSFGFEVSDGTGDSSEHTITIDVQAVNDTPSITGLASISDHDENVTYVWSYIATDVDDTSVTWNLSGPDLDDFSVGTPTNMGDGTGVISVAGLMFNSNPDFESPTDADGDNVYEVTLEATDGDDTDTLDVTVTVNDVDEPLSLNGPATIHYAENGSGPVGMYTAIDPEGGTITWSLSGFDAEDFDISTEGVLTFKSPPDFENATGHYQNHIYVVTVEASDSTHTRTQAVEVIVTDVNELVAAEDTAITAEDTAVEIDVVSNDTDPDGHILTVTSVTTPGYGTAVVTSGSTVTYTPNLDFNGTDTFGYTITDDPTQPLTVTGMVTVTVSAVNDAPTFPQTESGTRRVPEGALAGYQVGSPFAAVDVDEGDSLSYSFHEGLDGAPFDIDGSSGQITVVTNLSEDDVTNSPYSYTVRATDGSGSFADIGVSIKVDRLPVAVNDTATVPEGGSVDIYVVANDADADGDTLSVIGIGAGPGSPVNGSAVIKDGSTTVVTYIPDSGFTGEDSFTYGVSDGLTVVVGTVTVTVY